MKIYISGQITGLDLDEAHEKFAAASKMLDVYGWEPINPLSKDSEAENKTWEEYMIEGIALIFYCDAIYMLHDWQNSRGAKIEHTLAVALGLTIFYEATDGVNLKQLG